MTDGEKRDPKRLALSEHIESILWLVAALVSLLAFVT